MTSTSEPDEWFYHIFSVISIAAFEFFRWLGGEIKVWPVNTHKASSQGMLMRFDKNHDTNLSPTQCKQSDCKHQSTARRKYTLQCEWCVDSMPTPVKLSSLEFILHCKVCPSVPESCAFFISCHWYFQLHGLLAWAWFIWYPGSWKGLRHWGPSPLHQGLWNLSWQGVPKPSTQKRTDKNRESKTTKKRGCFIFPKHPQQKL